jgi:hypothetical protein
MKDADFSKLLHLAEQVLYGDIDARAKLQDAGITVTRSDFYSEIPTIYDIRNPKRAPRLDRIFPGNKFLLDFLSKISKYASEFNAPLNCESEDQFFWENSQFSYSDALSYYCVVRYLKPNQILEIGGGYSTLIAAEALKRNKSGKLKVLEPYPRDFLKRIPGIELIELPFQNLDSKTLASSIEPGDIVFIDSTHSIKYGSETLNIYLDFLHLINSDCYIHVHDIYLPESLPIDYMLNQQIFWGEQYLLYAYLLDNKRIEILYGSNYHAKNNPEELKQFMNDKYSPGGASFWFKQILI